MKLYNFFLSLLENKIIFVEQVHNNSFNEHMKLAACSIHVESKVVLYINLF